MSVGLRLEELGALKTPHSCMIGEGAGDVYRERERVDGREAEKRWECGKKASGEGKRIRGTEGTQGEGTGGHTYSLRSFSPKSVIRRDGFKGGRRPRSPMKSMAPCGP